MIELKVTYFNLKINLQLNLLFIIHLTLIADIFYKCFIFIENNLMQFVINYHYSYYLITNSKLLKQHQDLFHIKMRCYHKIFQ